MAIRPNSVGILYDSYTETGFEALVPNEAFTDMSQVGTWITNKLNRSLARTHERSKRAERNINETGKTVPGYIPNLIRSSANPFYTQTFIYGNLDVKMWSETFDSAGNSYDFIGLFGTNEVIIYPIHDAPNVMDQASVVALVYVNGRPLKSDQYVLYKQLTNFTIFIPKDYLENNDVVTIQLRRHWNTPSIVTRVVGTNEVVGYGEGEYGLTAYGGIVEDETTMEFLKSSLGIFFSADTDAVLFDGRADKGDYLFYYKDDGEDNFRLISRDNYSVREQEDSQASLLLSTDIELNTNGNILIQSNAAGWIIDTITISDNITDIPLIRASTDIGNINKINPFSALATSEAIPLPIENVNEVIVHIIEPTEGDSYKLVPGEDFTLSLNYASDVVNKIVLTNPIPIGSYIRVIKVEPSTWFSYQHFEEAVRGDGIIYFSESKIPVSSPYIDVTLNNRHVNPVDMTDMTAKFFRINEFDSNEHLYVRVAVPKSFTFKELLDDADIYKTDLEKFLETIGFNADPFMTNPLISYNTVEITEAFTPEPYHFWIKVDATDGDVEITLPDAEDLVGKTYIVTKTDVGANKVTFTSVDGIDYVETAELLAQFDTVIFQSGGKKWFVKNITTKYKVATVTATSYTATYKDHIIFVDGTSNNVTITLPPAASFPGREIVVKRVDNTANVVSVQRAGSDLLDSFTSKALADQYNYIILKSNGVDNWAIVSYEDAPASAPPTTTKTTTATLSPSDLVVFVDATSGSFTISLPDATALSGKSYEIKKIDGGANTVTIDPDGSQTIDGNATMVLNTERVGVFIRSDGTNWYTIASDIIDANNTTFVNIDDTDSPYTALTTVTTILADANDGAITINLPDAASVGGKVYEIKKTDTNVANNVTIDASSTQTIDGNLTVDLTSTHNAIVIASDGANWFVISRIVPEVEYRPYRTVTTDTTLSVSDSVVFVDATADDVEITLANIATVEGRELVIKRIDAEEEHVVTVIPHGAQTIGGETSYVLTVDNNYVEIKNDETLWHVVSASENFDPSVINVDGTYISIDNDATLDLNARNILVTSDNITDTVDLTLPAIPNNKFMVYRIKALCNVTITNHGAGSNTNLQKVNSVEITGPYEDEVITLKPGDAITLVVNATADNENQEGYIFAFDEMIHKNIKFLTTADHVTVNAFANCYQLSSRYKYFVIVNPPTGGKIFLPKVSEMNSNPITLVRTISDAYLQYTDLTHLSSPISVIMHNDDHAGTEAAATVYTFNQVTKSVTLHPTFNSTNWWPLVADVKGSYNLQNAGDVSISNAQIQSLSTIYFDPTLITTPETVGITLPQIIDGMKVDLRIHIKNSAAVNSSLKVNAYAGQTINGKTSIIFDPNESLILSVDTRSISRTNWECLVSRKEENILYVTSNGDQTLVRRNSVVVFNKTSSPTDAVVNLPPSNVILEGHEITVKKMDDSSYTVTVTRNGSQTIDGSNTFILDRKINSITLKYVSTNLWAVVSTSFRKNEVELAVTRTSITSGTSTRTYSVSKEVDTLHFDLTPGDSWNPNRVNVILPNNLGADDTKEFTIKRNDSTVGISMYVMPPTGGKIDNIVNNEIPIYSAMPGNFIKVRKKIGTTNEYQITSYFDLTDINYLKANQIKLVTGDLWDGVPVITSALPAIDVGTGNGRHYKYKTPCRVATIGTLIKTGTVSTSITNFNTETFSNAVDGVTLVVNDRILVKNQSNAALNGIYQVSSIVSGNVSIVRATDANSTGLMLNLQVKILEGNVNKHKVFRHKDATYATLNTTAFNISECPNIYNSLIEGPDSSVFIKTGITDEVIRSAPYNFYELADKGKKTEDVYTISGLEAGIWRVRIDASVYTRKNAWVVCFVKVNDQVIVPYGRAMLGDATYAERTAYPVLQQGLVTILNSGTFANKLSFRLRSESSDSTSPIPPSALWQNIAYTAMKVG